MSAGYWHSCVDVRGLLRESLLSFHLFEAGSAASLVSQARQPASLRVTLLPLSHGAVEVLGSQKCTTVPQFLMWFLVIELRSLGLPV